MMKKLAAVFALFIGACVLLLVQPAVTASSVHVKYDVCHVPPGNPDNAHIINVDASAWDNGHTPHNYHELDKNCTLAPGTCLQYPACVSGPVIN